MLKRKNIYVKLKMVFKAEKIKKCIKDIKHELLKKVSADGKITTTWLVKTVYNFCQLYSEINYYPYQEQFAKRLIRSLLENDGEEISALFSRQTGKSETVATTVGGCMIILPVLANMPMFADDKRLQMFKKGLMVGIFAPSLRQAQTTFNRMKTRLSCPSAIEVLQEFGLEFSTSNGQTVALTNGSFATSVSASDRSNIEGDSYMLIICEECQDISSFKIRKSIHPMGAAYNATIIKIGTATTFKGDFYEVIERNKRDYKEGKLRLRNHFEYDYKICQKYNENYRKYIEKEKHRLGEHSDEFRMAYCLEWILERGMFIDSAMLESLCGMKDMRRVASDLTKDHVVGIDIAKKGDSTVITVCEVDWEHPVIVEKERTKEYESIQYTAYTTRIKDWKELNGDDYDKQYYEIISYLKQFKVSKIMIDATKEEGMCDRLKVNLPQIEVVPCYFTSQFKDRMYKNLDSSIKCGRALYPNDEETQGTREYQKFVEQMGELEKNFRGQLMVCNHPARRGAHDDYADSWALACLGANDKEEEVKLQTAKENKFFNNKEYRGNHFYSKRNRFTARRR
nr:MAG TPA: Terminase [Caudoviricetes sp.]